MDYFTADPHFGHENIIQHCGRPFTDVGAMDEWIIGLWNARLRPGDRLFIVGDFCGQRRRAGIIQSYLERIGLHPDAIWLILGNHDDEKQSRAVFTHVRDVYTYKHPATRQKIFLSHYAHRVWNQCHRGRWHLYGHSHGNLFDDPHSLSFDCGVDCNNFNLWSFDEVAGRMATKDWLPVDHHGRLDTCTTTNAENE